jgi:hypothetical protein
VVCNGGCFEELQVDVTLLLSQSQDVFATAGATGRRSPTQAKLVRGNFPLHAVGTNTTSSFPEVNQLACEILGLSFFPLLPYAMRPSLPAYQSDAIKAI